MSDDIEKLGEHCPMIVTEYRNDIMNKLIDNVRLISPGGYIPCDDPRTLLSPVGRIAGLNVYESKHMTKAVPRTWRERLLTLPWRPWRSIKQVPSLELVYTKTCIYGHPIAIRALREIFARTWVSL